MQTILGAGGAIGVHLARMLQDYTDRVRLVSRNPKPISGDEELLQADLTQVERIQESVKGSEIVYLTIGLPYDHKVWESTWPTLMENVIRACSTFGSRLVFFDNNYMYDPDHLYDMTEDTPIHPPGRKGKVRARISRRLMEADEQGEIEALIVRAADFYGPLANDSSMLGMTVFKPLAQGKKANWMLADDKKHSFTYTPDAARATALLGNTESAYSQIWHLPTAPDPPTGREWIEMIAAQMNQKPRYRILSPWILSIAGLFNKQIREFNEVSYQYDRDYVFDSSKFEKQFNLCPTSYRDGIREIVENEYQLAD